MMSLDYLTAICAQFLFIIMSFYTELTHCNNRICVIILTLLTKQVNKMDGIRRGKRVKKSSSRLTISSQTIIDAPQSKTNAIKTNKSTNNRASDNQKDKNDSTSIPNKKNTRIEKKTSLKEPVQHDNVSEVGICSNQLLTQAPHESITSCRDDSTEDINHGYISC